MGFWWILAFLQSKKELEILTQARIEVPWEFFISRIIVNFCGKFWYRFDFGNGTFQISSLRHYLFQKDSDYSEGWGFGESWRSCNLKRSWKFWHCSRAELILIRESVQRSKRILFQIELKAILMWHLIFLYVESFFKL